jgi:hypothetical protein
MRKSVFRMTGMNIRKSAWRVPRCRRAILATRLRNGSRMRLKDGLDTKRTHPRSSSDTRPNIRIGMSSPVAS